jgi:8-oxo-dGTP diphosphatase
MKKLFINLLLFFTAIALAVVFTPFGVLFAVFSFKHFIKTLSNMMFVGAKSIDQFGNAFCFLFLNAVFIKNDSIHPFGDEDETISSVLGRNKLINNLTKTGILLDKILNFFDKNHSVDAIGE